MNKRVLLLLVSLLTIAVYAEDHSGKCGEDMTWTLSGGTLTISGSGEMNFKLGSPSADVWKSYKEQISTVIIQEGVKSVYQYAFYDCVNLKSISLPESLEKINEYAFGNCISISTLTIPSNVRLGRGVFNQCTNIKDVTINCKLENIYGLSSQFGPQVEHYTVGPINTELPFQIFRYCDDLQRVTLPPTIREIGDDAFRFCENLVEVDIKEGVQTIGKNALQGCKKLTKFAIPSTVTTISESAFYGCTTLSEINLPSSLAVLGERAFQCCSSLREITIPEGITSIELCTFADCEKLSKVTLPKSLISIVALAFYKCNSLESIIIPENVVSLGKSGTGQAFAGCDNLKDVTINSQAALKYAVEYEYPDVHYSLKELFGHAEHITIGGNVTEIGYRQFMSLTSLKSISLSDNISIIGKEAFYGCSGLTELNFPSALSEISERMLYGCSSIKEVTIPENIKIIGASAFSGCKSIERIVIPESISEINCTDYSGPFSRCENLREVELYCDAKYPNANNGTASFSDAFGKRIEKCIIGGKIKEIPNSFFNNSENLKSISLSDDITSIGAHAFSYCKSLPEIKFPNNLKTIGNSAFSGCESLSDIIFPESLTALGDYAFSDCKGIASITIPASLETLSPYSFSGCDNLKEVTINSSAVMSAVNKSQGLKSVFGTSVERYVIGEGIKTIKEKTFSGSENLRAVVLPETVTEIGDFAFFDCGKLSQVNIPSGLTEIGQYVFSKCSSLSSIKIPDGVTSIGTAAFSDCSGLSEIDIPEGVTEIGQSAFSKCTGLTSVVLPLSLTSMKNAFWNNPNLKEVTMNSNVMIGEDNDHNYYPPFRECFGNQVEVVSLLGNVTKIGRSALCRMENLKTVILGSNIVSIGNSAFSDCPKLENVYFAESDVAYESRRRGAGSHSLTTIGGFAFNGCSSLKGFAVTENVEQIGYGAFSGCGSLKDVDINSNAIVSKNYTQDNNISTIFGEQVSRIGMGDGVTAVGSYAFSGLSNMESVYIPNTVKEIGNGAFSGCKELTEVTLPESIEKMGDEVFDGCENLTSIGISEGATTIDGQILSYFKDVTTFTVPSTVTKIENGSFSNCAKLLDVFCNPDAATLSWDVEGSGLRNDVTVHAPTDMFSAYVTKFYKPGKAKFVGQLNTEAGTLDGKDYYWATFYCRNYNVRIQDDGVSIFTAKLGTWNRLYLTECEKSIANEGKSYGGYILRSESPVINVELTDEIITLPDENNLSGSDMPVSREDIIKANNGAKEVYVLGNSEEGIGFYRLSELDVVGSGRAYFVVNDYSFPQMVTMVYGPDTAINSINVDTAVSDGYWYTINGKRLNGHPVNKGVYIYKGKKLLINL